MVLGIRLILTAALALGTVPAGAETLDEAVLPSGGPVILSDEDGQCVISHVGALYSVGLPSPCRFLRRGDTADATVEDYRDRGAVIVIGGPLAHPDDYGDVDWISPADDCSHMGRGVIVRGDKVLLSAPRIERLGFCAHIAPDEKYYYGLAHDD